MKKIKVNAGKLQLNKQKVASLTNDQIEGVNGGQGVLQQAPGNAAWSAGCTDGCSPAGSFWNCTKANCSADCSGGFCPMTNTGYPGTMG